MTSPKTRRVLAELRMKDDNDVSIDLLATDLFYLACIVSNSYNSPVSDIIRNNKLFCIF